MDRATVRERWLWAIGHTLNKGTIRMAKWGHGPFSVIRHVGRRSGRTYEAPVMLARTPEGFVAELTYGDTVNWYRNAVAAGGCVVVRGRREYRIDRIEPCDPEGAAPPTRSPRGGSSAPCGAASSGYCAPPWHHTSPATQAFAASSSATG